MVSMRSGLQKVKENEKCEEKGQLYIIHKMATDAAFKLLNIVGDKKARNHICLPISTIK